MVFQLPDDGGSFDRLVREADEEAKGDESKKWQLLAKRIVKAFVQKIHQEKLEESVEGKRKASNVDKMSFLVPKRRRGSLREGLPSSVNEHKITLKRCFDQIQTCGNEQVDVSNLRNPKKQKVEKKGSNKESLHYLDKNGVPDMPDAFKLRIQEENGVEIKLVMQKKLEASDLDRGKNRLSIPKGKMKGGQFLNPEENNFFVENPKEGMKVLMVPPSLKGNVTLTLKRWKMGGNYIFNLIDKWYWGIVDDKENGLELGSVVQLWRFNKNDGGLCFALVRVEG